MDSLSNPQPNALTADNLDGCLPQGVGTIDQRHPLKVDYDQRLRIRMSIRNGVIVIPLLFLPTCRSILVLGLRIRFR